MTREEAILKIERATSPEALFGKEPESEYRKLAKLCHPDPITDPDLKSRAEKAFRKLGELRDSKKKPKPKPPVVQIGKWILTGPIAKGSLSDVHMAESSGVSAAAVKVVSSAKDNDLMENELMALRKLRPEKTDHPNPYVLRAVDFFKAKGRWINVIEYPQGYFTLPEILGHYPLGLDFRHIVWMMNRLLSALGSAHGHGIIHGAVFPEHLLFKPETHDLKLIDWCYSSLGGKPIQAIISNHKNAYPPEVKRKLTPSPSLDLYMAAQIMRKAARSVPDRFLDLFVWCSNTSPSARPSDAWRLQEKWKALAIEEYGPPKFARLSVPVY